MDGRESIGRGGADYHKDIEEMHFGGSTSEDDDDEPRLRIDTSEDEEDSTLENSSSSSSFSRRKPSTPIRLKNNNVVGSRGALPTKKFDVKNTNPLQSLQQLVHSHSPFLNAQISVADGGVNKGCKMTPFTPIGLARENRSKSNCDSQSLAAAAEALRNIFSNSHNNNSSISNVTINNWDALPTPRPKSGSGAKMKKSPSSSLLSNAAAKRNTTNNFHRLSPVSIEVVPSLSHLLPLSQHSPPSPQTPQQQALGENCDSSGGRMTNSNRLNYIVNKLQRSATEEEHLRQLQQLQSSPEAENFKLFQQFLKSGQFQARCNNNNLEILPAVSTAASNTINLTNCKGFRYSSSKAQTRPTFGNLSANSCPATSLPSPPPLTFQTAPEFSNPTNRMDFRMPPTLTVIPKNTGPGASAKKSHCRRSPPPMVPIESIANFRKPLNEDNVVYRLKKLGTDIELEKNNAASREDSAAATIEDVAVKAAPTTASVTNTSSSSNISDKAGLPFLKPIPIGERTLNDLKNLAKLNPPPPSLIPIKPVTQFVPIMPSLPQSTISEVPIKLKKNSRGRVPSFVSILPKVNVNQNDVLDMAAKIQMAKIQLNSGTGDIADGSQFMFNKGSSSDVIFTRKEDILGGLKQSNLDFSHLRLTLPNNKVIKKKKRNRLTTKSEYTKLAHALVQAATPLPKKEDIDRPVIVPIRNEMPPKELNLNDVEGEVITIEPILMPQSRRESEDIDNVVASDHEDEFVQIQENSSPSPESSTPALPPPLTPSTSGTVTEKEYFSFSPTLAIQIGSLPNGRKMVSCDICSGVYHKMFSLKKHYYRNHINPKFISEKHADMFQVPPISSTLSSNPKSNQSMYWCNICECLFDEKSELSSHLTDHPPITAENANKNNTRFYMCPTCNTVFSKKRTQERHSKKCENLFKTAGISTATKEPTVDSPQSGDDLQDDNVAEETNSTSSSKTNDDVMELDEMPSSSKNSKLETSMMCLFCELSFTDTTKRKKHVLQHHHPKRKQQPCVYCKNKTFSDLSDLLKHICEMHSKRYFGCAICKIRFRTKEDLVAHNAETHDGQIANTDKEPIIEEKVPKVATISNKNGKNYKCNQCTKVFINTVELGRHRKAAHRDSSRNNVKKVVSAFSGSIDNNEQQKYRSTIITTADYETEFYRNVCHNVKYNLENCMEGRIEMKKEENSQQDVNDARYADLPGGIGVCKEKSESLSFHDLYGTENIDSRFIQNVSRLHLATQLTMLRKANLLDKELDCPLRATKTSTASRSSSIASHLALAEKSDGERADDEAKNENDAANEIAFTGEWIRTRNYICGTCFARFNNFWDMEDHRWSRHPNVYGFYYEFVSEQTPGKNWAMKRSLQNHGSLGVVANQSLPSSSTCTKCQKTFTPVSEFHKHILDCGGDTTWMSMMYAAHTKRNKKWRPYGSKRRKNIARHRGLKRNIPTTPVKIIGPPRNRQKAGDTETIQRMIANLPPKRITRRVITFDDIDTRPRGRFSNNSSSQSNILTRRRKESMEVKSSSTSRSQSQQQQLQDSKQNVTTSKTLLGTKNNTPFNNNVSSSTTRRHREQTLSNTAAAKESTPLPAETKPTDVVSEISSGSTSVASCSKNKTVESDIKEETITEPEVCSIKVSTTKGGKTAKIILAKDTETTSEKSTASVTTSSQNKSDTSSKSDEHPKRTDSPIERETSTESKSLPKEPSSKGTSPTSTESKPSYKGTSSTSTESKPSSKGTSTIDEVTNTPTTVVKITTSWKNQSSSSEPVSIRKLRSSDDSNVERERGESVTESKVNSSCDERAPHNVTKTEPKSNSEVYSTLELRSGSGSRNKPLIIKIQGDGKQKNEPVTIIRSDKKKKKRCTPVTSKRLTAELPQPSPTTKETENQSGTCEKLVTETKSVATTEISDDLPVAVPAKSEDTPVTTEKLADLPVTSEKPAELSVETEKLADLSVEPEKLENLPVEREKSANLFVESEKSTNLSVEPEKSSDLPIVPEKLAPEITSEVKTEKLEDSLVAIEKSTSEVKSATKTETPKNSPTTPEKLTAEKTPIVVPEKVDDEPVTPEKIISETSLEASLEKPNDSPLKLEKNSTPAPQTLLMATEETKNEAVATVVETETREDEALPSDAVVVNTVSTELQTKPMTSSSLMNTTPLSTPTIDKPVPEPEEGEIDLSAIEPADEDGPLLPDTSVILAAMKETMRQTDAVISSMPIAVNASKKRKRDDHVKCKKCGVKVEASTNATQICECCTEVSAKKSKPASPPVPKIESFTCKTCHASVPKKIRNNDETCNKCVDAAAAAIVATTTAVTAAPAVAAAAPVVAATTTVTAAPAVAVAVTTPLAATVSVGTTTATVSVGTTVAIKNDKPTPKKCSPKLKDTRIPPPPPFRCRKCDSIGLAPLDGSMFCDKCSRLQETVCLLCKSSYISDTNDKVCGKCMLAGSSKQKKRIVDTDAPAIVTNTVTCDNLEKKSHPCDVCKNATKCTCKRRTSGQFDRAAVTEVACDSCGKMWKDEENFGGSICRICRSSRTPTKVVGARVSDLKESIKCLDCGIVVVPISSEAAMRKLCDGCFMRQNERRSSNEIRYLDVVKSAARPGIGIQRSPGAFSGFSAAADDFGRSKIEDMKGDHYKEEERPVHIAPPAATTEHKTPMKNVKLICRGCYGVFDTVSSYKYHCDNCKHRSNEKKPLLSFAKRTTKGGVESTTQAEPSNGASFEILEGVQIKYVEMAGSSQSDKAEAGKETSQIPLVVYESDTSPMKKSDSSRSLKKLKRLHSSPETIMDTIESVIKSVCYENVDPSSVAELNNEDGDEREKTPVKDVASVQQKPAESILLPFRCPLCDKSFQYCGLRNTHLITCHDDSKALPTSKKSTSKQNTTTDMKAEPNDGDDKKEPTKKAPSRSKSSKKRPSRKRKPAAKKSKKSDNTAEAETPSTANEDIDETDKSKTEDQSVKQELTEMNTEPKANEVEKQSKKSSTINDAELSNYVVPLNDTELRRSRRRACVSTTATNPAGRTLRSRTKFYENLNDLKNYMEPEETKSESEAEPMDVDDPILEDSLPPEDNEKSTSTPKPAAKKRKSDSSKNESKKFKTDSNDLGFNVTKTSKSIPKNCKKISSNDPKNFEQLDDEVESSSSTNQIVPSERTVVTRKTTCSSENIIAANAITPVAAVPLEGAKRRRSSEISIYDQASKYSSPSLTPSNENTSRRNSAATVVSFSGECQNDMARSFFDEAQGLESGSEYADGSSSKNVTPTYSYDEQNGNSFPEPYDNTEGTSQNSSPSYSNSWDFFGQKSLGSIIDTMNEILSRPEVSSCSSETVELFKEEMMMFQHFGREISAINKQEEESKQDEETTTLLDLDEVSGKADKSKVKIKSEAGCSSTNTLSEECDICDQTFYDVGALQSHMSSVHNNDNSSKNFKDNNLKQNNKSNQNGMKLNSKHKCNHCQKVLQSKAETLMHMKEHWKSFVSNKSDNSSHLKNSIADKLEELLLDKALMNYLKSPQETQHRNNLPLKILNQISLAKKNQFTNWKSALAQMLDMDANLPVSTTPAGPASPVEPAPITVESKPEEKATKSQGTETSNSNPDQLDGYPCPMCNKTFQYTRLRNTHLIMVHAPRQSTHKHLLEGKNNLKKGEKTKSSNENRDGNVRSSSAREKIFHSYLLNDSVNTVVKKELQEDSLPPPKPNTSSSSASSFPVVNSSGSKDTKKPEKRLDIVKSEPSVSPSSSFTTTTPTATSTPTSSSIPSAAANKPNSTTNVPAKSAGNDEDTPNTKKKKPCRKKMSKKEMNLPAAIVKMKAEQALLQLCNSRFNRICSQT